MKPWVWIAAGGVLVVAVGWAIGPDLRRYTRMLFM